MAPPPTTAPSPKPSSSNSSPPPSSDTPPSPPATSSPPPSSRSSPPPSPTKPPPLSSPPPLSPQPLSPPVKGGGGKPFPTPPSTTPTPTPPSAFFPPTHNAGGGSRQSPPAPSGKSPGGSRQSPGGSTPKTHSRPSSDSGSRSRSTTSHTSNTTVLDHAALIAGVAAAGFTLLLLCIVCVLCNRKKKKKPYYIDSAYERPPGGGGGAYYNNKGEHVVKFSHGTVGNPGGGGWRQPPPSSTSNDFSTPGMPPSPHMPLAFSKSQFTYGELQQATGGFVQSNLLGQGGFGYVHKGVLPNGQAVAVKSLKAGSGQGEREFQAEVEIISRVHHRHLVSLVGYCIADAQKMLVYEFVTNKTLEYHLHEKHGAIMDWQTRMRIALGSAKGLAYLHEDCHPRIIHRDIKSANILLDDNYEAMVADFGLAKLTSGNDTHVSTRVMGTFGYLAPEYASSGKLTEKSDVFSFGVMLLEIMTGRKPVDPNNQYMDESLVDWARPLLTKASENGDYGELVDPRLGGNYEPAEMARMGSCAAAGVRHSAKRRPKMSQIVRALEGDASLDSLNDAGKRAPAASANPTESSLYDTRAYNDDMMKFKKMVMSSQEYPSSEFGGQSSSSADMSRSGPYRHKP